MRVLTQQGHLLIKTNLRGGACQTGGAYWKEGDKTNHYGISLLQHQNYCDQNNQTMYFSRTLGEGSVWGKRVWVQGPLRRNIFQTTITKTSITIYPSMLTITTFTKVSNWCESNLLKGNTSKYRYSKQLQRDNDDLLLNVVN